MMTGLIQDQNLEKQIEKQIGCMSGFLHIFDRQHILTGKRIYNTKRLPASTVLAGSPESVKSVQSVREMEQPVVSTEPVVTIPEGPDRFQRSAAISASTPPRSPLPLPIFELKEGSMKNSWKFCKEMPRLSLDSRATVDSKGSLCAKEIRAENGINSDEQRRSPSVVARLMGLEQLPSSDSVSSPESVKKPELRRSASESRVSRDLFHSRFIECNNNSQAKHAHQTNKQPAETHLPSVRDNANNSNNNSNNNRNVQNGRVTEAMKYSRNQKNDAPKASQWRSPQQRRSFFDSGDVFPEPKQMPVYEDYEKNLKLRGIDDRSKDLETLKHILEALQFKGLLHSNRPLTRDSQRNFVYDPSLLSDHSNEVLIKPWRSPGPNRRVKQYTGEVSPSVSPRKDRGVLDRSGRSPVRGRNSSPAGSRLESNSKNGNTIVKRKPLSIETERRLHESSESRRNSPINSPKLTPKRSGSDHFSVNNRSPRSNRTTEMVYSKQKFARNMLLAEDESSSFSESSGSTTSQSDLERMKLEENRDGKSLLARCDKLLHSIAEMNSITESHTSFNSVLPSPVSVLNSAFDKDESSSPSPVMKRSIDFQDLAIDLEDEEFEFISNDSDFTYISEILRASKHLSDDSTVFFFLEKQHYITGTDTSKCSKLRRKLVFDVVGEIIDRNRELPPWSLTESTDSVKQICAEFEKVREPETAENLLDLICTVMKRDLAGNNDWSDQPVEVSEAVLCIERLIFKDLVSETIRDLADFAGKTTVFAPRRKLVF